MRFSQRIGKRPVKTELEKDGLCNELKNSFWTLLLEFVIKDIGGDFFRDVWIHFFKYPIDNLPSGHYGGVDVNRATTRLREWYYDEAEWDEILDLVEFSSDYNPQFQELANKFLKRELSAYRFVDGVLVEVNSAEEVIEIEKAINSSDKFKSVKSHLRRAVELYSDRKNPDFRNSIKESISAVESLATIIVEDDKATLGKALAIIERKHKLPGSLKASFNALYGYTSEEGGIRHSLLENGVEVEMEEARFMMITCSAFVNYLMNKL